MLKEIFIGVIIVICILGAYLYGYIDHMENVPNNCTPTVEWREINVPVPPNYSLCEKPCGSEPVKICDNESTIIVYKDIPSERYTADVYYQVAIKQTEGFYDNIKRGDYINCTIKMDSAQDYLLTSIGFYQLSGQDLKFKVQALQELRKVWIKILSFCDDEPETNSFNDVEDDYEDNYAKYSRYLGYINETAIKIK